MDDLSATEEVKYLAPSERPIVLRVSDALRSFVDFVGRWAAWLILPLIVITVFDVTAQKAGVDSDLAGRATSAGSSNRRCFRSSSGTSTPALFALVLGYGYIWNTHVRVDLVRENLAFRKKAWLELVGPDLLHDPLLPDRDLVRLRSTPTIPG